ncbi:phosphoribosylanthranilate isomerase [Massilibacteroides sp.]|uniref:phosphoribosylanthranilate isomerase n=1 Tax=Massilibacteroides sp. TaxID=2034766 RepID=UPI002610E72C|nr:phosphoribosylanthranilate isomerase [Massilibacteroides sp.]MDD4514447.1 phosphoribosylanthranilate isomerase [Massilibacteroides sp.]
MGKKKIVKVCGMRDTENIKSVIAAGADWIGFIFYEHSPRFIDEGTEFLRGKIQHGDRHIKKVGVFVDASLEEMLSSVVEYNLDYLQLHGEESPDTCYALQKRGISVIKAFPVATEEDLQITRDYEGRADYFLFDTRSNLLGGSGKQFDWQLLNTYKGETPFLLSGGLSPDSLTELQTFSHTRFAGIDLNSGFESAPAQKDAMKIKKFISDFLLHQK